MGRQCNGVRPALSRPIDGAGLACWRYHLGMVGRFDERFLDEIKSRLRPSDVIGKTVKLRKQGREYVGLSPFTKEKTPVVLRQRRQGPVLRLLVGQDRRPDHLPAGDPAALASPRPSSGWPPRRAWRCRRSIRARVEAGEEAPGPRRLAGAGRPVVRGRAAPPGRPRGPRLSREARPAREGVGAVPAGLLAAGPHRAEGLSDRQGRAARRAGRDRPADRAGGRRRSPTTASATGSSSRSPTPRGRIISFGGRAMDPQARAKYLNGPESPVFHKGHQLYGLSEARKIIAAAPSDEHPPLVVVEGYMDVIACQRGGDPGGGADGHGADRRADGDALAPPPGADALLRRRPGRAPGRRAQHGPRAAAAEGRPQLPVRHRRGRQGSRRGAARAGARGAEGPARQDHAASPRPCSSASATPSRWTRPSSARR